MQEMDNKQKRKKKNKELYNLTKFIKFSGFNIKQRSDFGKILFCEFDQIFRQGW